MGGRRAVFGACLLVSMFVAMAFSAVGTAQGQEDGAPYQPQFGDLDIEGTDFTPGTVVTFAGSGFAPNAAVQVAVRSNASGEAAAETTDEADDVGAVRFELQLTDSFTAGNYTATMAGPAIDGATVQLSGVMTVYALPAPTSTPVPVEPAAPAPTPTAQRPDVESPTPTPLPEVTVRNDPPPTVGPAPETSDDPDGATADDDAEVAGASEERATTADGDEPAPADPSAEDAPDNVDAPSADEPGNEPADGDEEALAGVGGDGGDGSGSRSWLVVGAVVAGLCAAGGLVFARRARGPGTA